jgi:hypothetical protein
MLRKDLPLPENAPLARKLSDWKTFGNEKTVANITLSGFEFGPVPDIIEKRCDFINALLQDPANGV